MSNFCSDLTIENTSKYPCAPSWEVIESFIKEMGMSMYRFERFYGISYNTLTQVKSGKNTLAAKHWHIFYEKIKTPYGAGFVKEFEKKQLEKLSPKPQKVKKKKEKKEPIQPFDIHSRLQQIK